MKENLKARSDVAEIVVTISGPVGCGKSAVAGEIEIALKAIGVPVRYSNPAAAQSEKHMTHADWQTYLEMYKPSVVLVEENEGKPKGQK
jgi:deoxyadenosine/deoxycytidine kinase